MALVRNLAFERSLQQKFGRKYHVSNGKNGTEYQVCCPFCIREIGKVDKKFKLYINPSKGVWRCWRCDRTGIVNELIKEFKTNAPVVNQQIVPLPENIQSPGDLVPLVDLPEDHVAVRYLRNRKFDPDVLDKRYGVRFCIQGKIIGGRFNTSNTIVFPIWMNNKLVGWQARLLYDPDQVTEEQYELYGFTKDSDGEWQVPPKYMTSPGLDKGRILFNYDNARKHDVIVVCEGPFDAISVGLNGVATLGKGVTEYQERLIKAYWKFAVILLDPDDADYEMLKLEQSLRMAIPCVSVSLKGYKDAGEMSTEEIWRQIFNELDRQKINLARILNEEH